MLVYVDDSVTIFKSDSYGWQLHNDVQCHIDSRFKLKRDAQGNYCKEAPLFLGCDIQRDWKKLSSLTARLRRSSLQQRNVPSLLCGFGDCMRILGFRKQSPQYASKIIPRVQNWLKTTVVTTVLSTWIYGLQLSESFTTKEFL